MTFCHGLLIPHCEMKYFSNNLIRICEMYLMDAPKIRVKKSIILMNMNMNRILQEDIEFQLILRKSQKLIPKLRNSQKNDLILRNIQKLIQKLRMSQKNGLILRNIQKLIQKLRNIQKLIQKLRKSQKKMIMS